MPNNRLLIKKVEKSLNIASQQEVKFGFNLLIKTMPNILNWDAVLTTLVIVKLPLTPPYFINAN